VQEQHINHRVASMLEDLHDPQRRGPRRGCDKIALGDGFCRAAQAARLGAARLTDES
jgi:hypothetical protein